MNWDLVVDLGNVMKSTCREFLNGNFSDTTLQQDKNEKDLLKNLNEFKESYFIKSSDGYFKEYLSDFDCILIKM